MRRLLLVVVLLGPTLHGCDRQTARFEVGDEAFRAGNYAAALEVWTPLAEAGYAPAQLGLGTLYLDGKGVPQDFAQAQDWLRRAAQGGSGGAMIRLGQMYFEGQGVEPDLVEAYVWVALAHERADPTAPMVRRGLVRHMSAEEIAAAERRAAERTATR